MLRLNRPSHTSCRTAPYRATITPRGAAITYQLAIPIVRRCGNTLSDLVPKRGKNCIYRGDD